MGSSTIYFFNNNKKYVGKRELNEGESIPKDATLIPVEIAESEEAFFVNGNWRVNEIINKKTYIIDNVREVTINPEEYSNEVTTLSNLKEGLSFLYNYVFNIEQEFIIRNEGHDITFFGRSPDLPGYIFNLLPCFYHWFGTSMINYARLVGYVVSCEAGEHIKSDLNYADNYKKVRTYCSEYVESISELTEVLKWRNKVGAHFAITDPCNRRGKIDNIATLEASIIYPIAFSGGRFRTAGYNFGKIIDGKCIESEIPKWSLTEVFENIAPRFWPDI